MTATNSPFPAPPEKRSPFPKPALPQAGDSLREAAFNLIFDKWLVYVGVASTLAGVAAAEWWARLWKVQLSPWFWTGATILVGAFATYRWYRIKPELDRLRLGIRGERAVGRMLDGTRKLGYEVFHDIPGTGFNVDHVLVGPGGVFAIETKTRTKPSGTHEITYDGERVLVNGFAPDRDPIVQAKAGAGFIRDQLEKMIGRTVAVRPVVLFPGWFVNGTSSGREVWVLNEKAFLKFIKNEPEHLKRQDIALLADRLTLHLTSE